MKTIDDLFETDPPHWGFRGDPYLWRELKAGFEEQSLEMDQDKFSRLLDASFHHLINTAGSKLGPHSVKFASFPQSGMSGGSISLNWWEETGLPLLKKRYAQLLAEPS